MNRDRDRGGVLVEFAGLVGPILLVLLVCFEALMVSLTVERVENAARTGARAASKERSARACRSAALNAMPDWVNRESVRYGSSLDGYYCRVRADVPLLWRSVPLDMTVERTVHMPVG